MAKLTITAEGETTQPVFPMCVACNEKVSRVLVIEGTLVSICPDCVRQLQEALDRGL